VTFAEVFLAALVAMMSWTALIGTFVWWFCHASAKMKPELYYGAVMRGLQPETRVALYTVLHETWCPECGEAAEKCSCAQGERAKAC
jgi:hypothetical protein